MKKGTSPISSWKLQSDYNLAYADAEPVGEPVMQLPKNSKNSKDKWTLKQSDVKVTYEPMKTSSTNDWENQHVIGINKEAATATFVPFADSKSIESRSLDMNYPGCRTARRAICS